jgi:hypothetical protein
MIGKGENAETVPEVHLKHNNLQSTEIGHDSSHQFLPVHSTPYKFSL